MVNKYLTHCNKHLTNDEFEIMYKLMIFTDVNPLGVQQMVLKVYGRLTTKDLAGIYNVSPRAIDKSISKALEDIKALSKERLDWVYKQDLTKVAPQRRVFNEAVKERH